MREGECLARADRKRTVKVVLAVGLLLLLCRFADWYRYTHGNIPLSTLPVSRPSREEIEPHIGEDPYEACPSVTFLRDELFRNPQTSPNSRWSVVFDWLNSRTIMRMYDERGGAPGVLYIQEASFLRLGPGQHGRLFEGPCCQAGPFPAP